MAYHSKNQGQKQVRTGQLESHRGKLLQPMDQADLLKVPDKQDIEKKQTNQQDRKPAFGMGYTGLGLASSHDG